MILAIIYTLLIVFCILGISDVIFLFKLFFKSPKKRKGEYSLVFLCPEDYKLQLLSALEKKNWYGDLYCNKIIAVTEKLNLEQTEECKNSFCECDVTFVSSLKDIDYSKISERTEYARNNG